MNRFKIRINSTAAIILLTFLIVSVPFYLSSVSEISHFREGCERLNVVRSSVYTYIDNDATTRERTLKNQRLNKKIIKQLNLDPKTLKETRKQTRIAINEIKTYLKNDKQALINLEKSTEVYATKEGGITVNCSNAYPMPFPINYIE